MKKIIEKQKIINRAKELENMNCKRRSAEILGNALIFVQTAKEEYEIKIKIKQLLRH